MKEGSFVLILSILYEYYFLWNQPGYILPAFKHKILGTILVASAFWQILGLAFYSRNFLVRVNQKIALLLFIAIFTTPFLITLAIGPVIPAIYTGTSMEIKTINP